MATQILNLPVSAYLINLVLHYKAIGNQMEYALSDVPVCMLDIILSYSSTSISSKVLDQEAARFQDRLPNNNLTV